MTFMGDWAKRTNYISIYVLIKMIHLACKIGYVYKMRHWWTTPDIVFFCCNWKKSKNVIVILITIKGECICKCQRCYFVLSLCGPVFHSSRPRGGVPRTQKLSPPPTPLVGAQDYQRFLFFKARSGSEYSFACFACCQGLCWPSFRLPDLFNLLILSCFAFDVNKFCLNQLHFFQTSLIINSEMCHKQWNAS